MIVKQKILVTGANGQLGKELQQLSAEYPQFNFIFLSKEDLDITDREKVVAAFENERPQYLINAAAYTAVDKAEEEQSICFAINADATAILAQACKDYNALFLHFSTDYVFEGNATLPYKETDTVNPQSVYGLSKLNGEQLGCKINPEAIIIRTSWVYSEYGKNFVKTMLKLMAEKATLNVVNDQQGSPTYAADIADLVMQMIFSQRWQPGIYHYCNSGVISWYDFAIAIKELTGSPCSINPIPTSAYPTKAKRPAYSALNCDKLQKEYDIKLKEWKQSLDKCLSRLDIQSGIN